MSGEPGDEELYTKPLGRLPVLYYGVGHMLNDITSACWFTYLLVFLSDIGLSPSSTSAIQNVSEAAVVMLSGQLADGFTTVLAGELIDRFGHFKIWHGAGSLLVVVSFSSVFGGCLLCKIVGSSSLTLETVTYSTFAAIFNIGWAATQVSHMSMVNCMTLNSTSRVVLSSCRNAFTMVANLSLYAIAFFAFKLNASGTSLDVQNQYRWITYTSIAVGFCFVAIFHFGTEEPRLKQVVHRESSDRISWSYWFKKILYHQVALVYVLTRLVTNVSQAFLAFYLINDLLMPQASKAVVPAITYVFSFIVSVLLQEMAWTGTRVKAFYSVGGLLWLFSGASLFFLPRSLSALVYPLSIIVGIANALMMVTGVSMQSFLVGEDVHGCAFVYGSLSFLDRVTCGFALCILESYQSPVSETDSHNTANFSFSVSRYGLGLVPAICALLGVVITCSMRLHNISSKALKEPLLA